MVHGNTAQQIAALKRKYVRVVAEMRRAKLDEASVEGWKQSAGCDLELLTNKLEELTRRRSSSSGSRWIRFVQIRRAKRLIRKNVKLMTDLDKLLVSILKEQELNLDLQQKLLVAIIVALLGVGVGPQLQN